MARHEKISKRERSGGSVEATVSTHRVDGPYSEPGRPAGGGHDAKGLFSLQWFGLSEAGLEGAIYNRQAMRSILDGYMELSDLTEVL